MQDMFVFLCHHGFMVLYCVSNTISECLVLSDMPFKGKQDIPILCWPRLNSPKHITAAQTLCAAGGVYPSALQHDVASPYRELIPISLQLAICWLGSLAITTALFR